MTTTSTDVRISERAVWTRILASTAFLLTALYLSYAAIHGIVALAPILRFWWPLAGLAALAVLAWISRFHVPIWAIALAATALSVVWGIVNAADPVSDFAEFFDDAAHFARAPSLDPIHASKSPTLVLVYGTWMTIFGVSVQSAQIVGSIAHGLVTLCVGALPSILGFGNRVGRLAALMYALSPVLIAYSPLVSSEAMLLLMVVPGVTLYLKATSERSTPLWLFGVSGGLLGLGYLATAVGGFFAIGAAITSAARAADSRQRRDFLTLGVLVAAMALAPLAQTGLNLAYEGRLSPTTSKNAAMGLLTGSNRECKGRTCPQDLELVGFTGPNQVDFDEASERAMEVVISRWTSDPLGLLYFAATTKVSEMWENESHILGWAVRGSPHLETWDESGTLRLMRRTVDAYFIATLLAIPVAVVVVWRRRLKLPSHAAAVCIGLLGTAGIHMVMVVQQRYHLIFLPFIFTFLAIAAFGREQSDETASVSQSGGALQPSQALPDLELS